MSLVVHAEDRLSGVAGLTVLLDGILYDNGSAIHLADLLGMHTVEIALTDTAGNTVSAVHRFEVSTSLHALNRLMEKYEQSGDLTGPLIVQLRQSAKQAEHHMDKGSPIQAVKHMEEFIKYLHRPALNHNVSDYAKWVLDRSAKHLIDIWSSSN